jgi:hypothetical protein
MFVVLYLFALLTYSAFFALLNFTLYCLLTKSYVVKKKQIILLALFLTISLLLQIPALQIQHVMSLSKFVGLLPFSFVLILFYYFGKYGISRIYKVVPKEKQETKTFSFIIAFQRFFWFRLTFIFFSLFQIIAIWHPMSFS